MRDSRDNATLPTGAREERPRERLLVVFPWLEVFFGLALGLVLYLPLDRKDLGEISWIVAATLGLGRLGYLVALRNEMRPLHELLVSLGLRAGSDQELRELVDLHDKITAPQLQILRSDVMREASNRLRTLANDATSDLLPPSEYYEWLTYMLTTTDPSTHVRAVSTMLESEWNDSAPERKFLQENVAAARRGVQIERIFVVPESRLRGFPRQRVAEIHADPRLPSLRGYVIASEALVKADEDLDRRIGEGFIAFGAASALIDVTVPPDQACGIVTVREGRVRELVRAFEQVKFYAAPIPGPSGRRP